MSYSLSRGSELNLQLMKVRPGDTGIFLALKLFASSSPHKEQIAWFKADFAKRFKIKDLGELKHVLGLKIERDRAERTLMISQCSYVKKLLKGLSMEEDTHKKATIPIDGYDSIQPATDEEAQIDKTEYARVMQAWN